MSQTLYELQTGKVNRKIIIDVHAGTIGDGTFSKGYRFVPSPGELASNRDRLKPVGLADDDSVEVQEAKLNTNFKDHPNFGKAVKAKTKDHDMDIRKLNGADAIAQVEAADDLAKLDKFFEQEMKNTPKIRKMIIKAISDKRDEMLAIGQSSREALLADGTSAE